MKTETKKRMDGLVNELDMNGIKKGTRCIIRDLKDDGFEDHEIFEYICELVQEGGSE